jgi:hypothetical protein
MQCVDLKGHQVTDSFSRFPVLFGAVVLSLAQKARNGGFYPQWTTEGIDGGLSEASTLHAARNSGSEALLNFVL